MTSGVSPPVAIRGIRTSLPSGTLIGRTSKGTGAPELVSIASLGAALSASGTVAAPQSPVSYLGFFLKGPLRANAYMYGAISHLDLSFPTSLVTSVARCKTAATATAALTLGFDGTGSVATISFSAGASSGTVTWLGTYSLLSNTIPYILTPNVPDLTLGDVDLLFAGDLV